MFLNVRFTLFALLKVLVEKNPKNKIQQATFLG